MRASDLGFAGNLVPTNPQSCNPQVCFLTGNGGGPGLSRAEGRQCAARPAPRETSKPRTSSDMDRTGVLVAFPPEGDMLHAEAWLAGRAVAAPVKRAELR